jgi:large subunit ribosomal protein L14e
MQGRCKMIEQGRVCIKLAGRDSKSYCTIIDILDENYVMIDGQCRRKKCNISHLEPLDKVLKLKKNASHEEVARAFKEIGVELKEAAKIKDKKSEKPAQQRKTKAVTTDKKSSSKKK